MGTTHNKLITCAIAAKQLGFSHDYIRRLCAKGKIKAEKVANIWVMTQKAASHIKRRRRLNKLTEI